MQSPRRLLCAQPHKPVESFRLLTSQGIAMRYTRHVRLRYLAAVGFVVTMLATTAYGQILPRNRNPGKAVPATPAAPATPSVTPAPAAPAVGETAGEVRREGRQ